MTDPIHWQNVRDGEKHRRRRAYAGLVVECVEMGYEIVPTLLGMPIMPDGTDETDAILTRFGEIRRGVLSEADRREEASKQRAFERELFGAR